MCIRDSAWNDSVMVYRQPALANGILWGDGIMQPDGVYLGKSMIWRTKVGESSLCSATEQTWRKRFVDPNSLRDNSELISVLGEDAVGLTVTFGSPGTWFYPTP